MENPDLFYLSVEDYKAQSLAQALVSPLTDPQVESLLLEVMVAIDGRIGEGWTPYDDAQEFHFPRSQDTDADDNEVIPRPVALATRILADALLTRRSAGVLSHELVSETNLGHSYTRKQTSQAEPGYEWWPTEVFGLIDQYRINGGQFAQSYPDGVGYVYV